MKIKTIQFIPALFVLLVIGFRYFSVWCADGVAWCYSSWINQISLSITKPAFYFSLILLPLAVILVFVPRSLFVVWLKVALLAIPLSAIYILATPEIDTSLIPFHRDDAARLAGGIFTIVSLLIVAWKYRSLK